MKKYDLVVVGGGLSGFCAAMAAARLGTKTALVQDRPVLGGNSSSEIRVPIGGASDFNPWARETGIFEEFFLKERRQASRRLWIGEATSIWDLVLYAGCYENKLLDLYLNTKCVEVRKANDTISSIRCMCIDKEEYLELSAPIFLDATGDGTVAYFAGAETRMGREGKDEFGESLAPEEPDDQVMGSTLTFHTEDAGRPVEFVRPEWVPTYKTDEDLLHRTHVDIKTGYWWIEVGNPPYNTITDADKIRDELYRQLLGVWDHIKNQGDHGAENLLLDFVGAVPGKRESRRIVGPYMMREYDIQRDRKFPDAVAYGGWFCDVHTMGGILNLEEPPEASFQEGNLTEEDARQVYVYSIPLRSLYSKDIPNLLMAGRNISVTHVALGTTRLMATCAVIGQAAGTAAAYCSARAKLPRSVTDKDILAIQQQLLKDDCYIPGHRNQDEKDLIRQSRVTVSSEGPLVFPNRYRRGYEYEHPRQKIMSRSNLDVPRAQLFPCTTDMLEKVTVFIQSDSSNTEVLSAALIETESIHEFDLANTLKELKIPVEPNCSGWVTIDLNCPVKKNSMLWLSIASAEKVYWLYDDYAPTGTVSASRIIQNHRPQKGSYTLKTFPQMFPYQGENLLSGQTRPERWTNIWISDPDAGFPAWAQFDFPYQVTISRLQMVFDTNLTLAHVAVPGLFTAKECVKDYTIYYRKDGIWVKLLTETNNYLRLRRHTFDAVRTDGIKLEILAANGDRTARVYEVRAYE